MSPNAGELIPIIVAIARVRDECGHIEKDGYNDFHKYHYVSEAALVGAVRPLMAKHGLVIIQSVVTEGLCGPRIDEHGVTHLVLEFTLAHESGTVWPEKFRVACSGNDRDSKGKWSDKGAYKANTGGFKYFLNRLFMVDTGDDPEREKKKKRPAAGGGQPSTSSKPSGSGDQITEGQRGMLWARSKARIEAIMSDAPAEIQKDATVELLTIIKDRFLIKHANELLKRDMDGFLAQIERAELNEDSGIYIKEATK
jgi:hypothetical protein